MKKKLIGICVVALAVIGFAGHFSLANHFSLAGHSSLDKDLLLANIEALAQTESKGVDIVQQGTGVQYDAEGNVKIIHFCNCIGTGTLNCPC